MPTISQGCQMLSKIWQVFVQFMANFLHKILKIAVFFVILIFRYLMFSWIHISSIRLNFLSLTVRRLFVLMGIKMEQNDVIFQFNDRPITEPLP